MDGHAELDASLGRQAGVALDNAVLHLDRAAHRVGHAAKFDQAAIPGPLDDAAMMGGDGGVDEIAAEAAKTRERALLMCANEPAVADYVCDQDRREFPGLAHSSASPAFRTPSRTAGGLSIYSVIHLTVSLGSRRPASASATFASSILPSSA
jgi:hypothetical protein